MIPFVRDRFFVSLSENARKITHPRKKRSSSVPVAVSLKNSRRVKKYHKRKLEKEKSNHFEKAFIIESKKHASSKDNSFRQIELLKAHLSLYKGRFEDILAKNHFNNVEKNNSYKLEILDELKKELAISSRRITLLAKKKTISVSESDELRSLVLRLKKLISEKSSLIKKK